MHMDRKRLSRRIPGTLTSLSTLASALILALICLRPAFSAQTKEPAEEQVRTEIQYRDGTVVLTSDSQKRISKSEYRAEGHVRITYQDVEVTGDEAQYNWETRDGSISGQVLFSQKEQWLKCSRAEFNFGTQTGTFYNASGYTDRQFHISSHTIAKTGPDTYKLEEGIVTACPEKRPKWSFQASQTNVRTDHTARLHNTVFRIKGVPVLYFPYIVMPLEKKVRSSGLIPFHTGSSTSKGRLFSEGWYQTLGPSADAMIYGDYFSLRGLAIGGYFRTRPNPQTRLYVQAYGINDKSTADQSGVQLVVDGVSQLKDDWRAVAKVNITSSFTFRQAFSDSFHSATVSQELASAFLTRDHGSFSTNIAFQRQEVYFPAHSLVTRKIPSLEFLSLGTPLGKSPFVFTLRTSLDGLTRLDQDMETQRLVQRLDFNPTMSVRLPPIKGFSIVPSIGVRETYYGAQRSDSSQYGVANDNLNRHYADLSIDFRSPVLEGTLSFPWLGKVQHTIEPFVTYRWIHGIKDFDKIIRFDETDAITNTNEVEYGIVNRFFKARTNSARGEPENHEIMSFALIQKYYFDPTFGGAFRPGEANAFHPLDTVTGFYQTGTMSNLAPISAIFQFSPQNGIHNDFRADFDARLQRWRDESLSTFWQQGKLHVSGTYFRTEALQPGMLPTNHVQGRIAYGSYLSGLSSSFTVSYNLRTSQWLNSNTKVNYTWNCCGIALEFNQFDLGARIESRFSFSFTLKGIGSFGNMKRSESIF
jgi:LPS-assembly protein